MQVDIINKPLNVSVQILVSSRFHYHWQKQCSGSDSCDLGSQNPSSPAPTIFWSLRALCIYERRKKQLERLPLFSPLLLTCYWNEKITSPHLDARWLRNESHNRAAAFRWQLHTPEEISRNTSEEILCWSLWNVSNSTELASGLSVACTWANFPSVLLPDQ